MRLHFEKIGGREECVGFEVWGGSPADEDPEAYQRLEPKILRAADVRRPPFGELVTRVRKEMARHAQETLDFEGTQPLLPETVDYLRNRIASSDQTSEPTGRPKLYGPDHFAEVAEEYRQAWVDGAYPLKAIAQRWNVSKSAAAKWVARCRTPEMGLLPPTNRGVARVEEDS